MDICEFIFRDKVAINQKKKIGCFETPTGNGIYLIVALASLRQAKTISQATINVAIFSNLKTSIKKYQDLQNILHAFPQELTTSRKKKEYIYKKIMILNC